MATSPIEKIIMEHKKAEKKEDKEKTPISFRERVLKENEVESSHKLTGGVNETIFTKIKDDGKGVFKPGSKEKGGTPEIGKGYKRERAAYLVDMFLGFNLVPPTVVRNIDNEEGSLQEFIPDASAGWELKRDGIEGSRDFMKQAGRMMLLDMLTGNIDRHSGNFLVDKNKKLWAIDNGCSFDRSAKIVESMWGPSYKKAHEFIYDNESVQKLKELNKDEGKKQILLNLLSELLGKKEICLFFKRLELISDNIIGNHLAKDAAESISKELEVFSREYDRDIVELIQNPESKGLTQQEVINQLFEAGQEWAVAENLEKFEGLDKQIALKLIEAGKTWAVAENLEKFEGLDKEIALKIIEADRGQAVAKNLEKFEGLDHKEIALKIIEAGWGWTVANNLEKFKLKESEYIEIRNKLKNF